jgi:hypothetical protein
VEPEAIESFGGFEPGEHFVPPTNPAARISRVCRCASELRVLAIQRAGIPNGDLTQSILRQQIRCVSERFWSYDLQLERLRDQPINFGISI